MSKNKVIKSVSFNNTSPDDIAMLDHIKRRNFSGYVKKLIKRDLDTHQQESSQNEPTVEQKEAPKPLTASEKIQGMKQNMKKTGKTPGPKKFY